MKKMTLISAFVLINVTFLCAQNMFVKKITTTLAYNFQIFNYYKYNSNWQLDSIIEVTELGDTIRLFLYNNDSLKAEISASIIWTYNYFADDSIVEYTISQPSGSINNKSGVYFINADFEISSYKALNSEGNYLWTIYYTYQNGNCTEILKPDGFIETMLYSDYLNPHFNEKKYFRRAFQGSVNFMDEGDFSNY